MRLVVGECAHSLVCEFLVGALSRLVSAVWEAAPSKKLDLIIIFCFYLKLNLGKNQKQSKHIIRKWGLYFVN